MPLSRTVRFAYAFALVFPLALAHPVAAQRRPAPEAVQPQQPVRDTTAPSIITTQDAEDTRRQLEDVMKAYPSTLPRILRMDPTLVNNPAYLEPYPALTNFLNQHPE